MDDEIELIPIGVKEFNSFVKNKGIKYRNKISRPILKQMFGFCSLVPVTHISLILSTDDMEPTLFSNINSAARTIGVTYCALKYAYKKGKNSFTRRVDRKKYLIEWLN